MQDGRATGCEERGDERNTSETRRKPRTVVHERDRARIACIPQERERLVFRCDYSETSRNLGEDASSLRD